LGTHRRILLYSAVAASLAFTLGCGKKASEQPVAQSQATASPGSADSASPWRIELKISPDHPSMTKPITFAIHIADERGQPVNDAQVSGVLTMKVMDMGTTALKFSPKGSGDYEASTKSVDMSGPWNLAVDVVNGSTHAKKNFDVTVFD
jgi:nitrogen fixation protein FixH